MKLGNLGMAVSSRCEREKVGSATKRGFVRRRERSALVSTDADRHLETHDDFSRIK
jgi:hypothetical protein